MNETPYLQDNELLGQALRLCPPDAIHPMIYETLSDPDFLAALPPSMKEPQTLAKYLEHSSRFANMVDKEKILGAEVHLPPTFHENGSPRRGESGRELNLKILSEDLHIDPAYVLYFRRTQPTEKPKPEYYWTSDYGEVLRGLTQEIQGKKRSFSIVLCSTLADIAQDGGVMTDINDDNGVAVRRINIGQYDQMRAKFILGQSSPQQPEEAIAGICESHHDGMIKITM